MSNVGIATTCARSIFLFSQFCNAQLTVWKNIDGRFRSFPVQDNILVDHRKCSYNYGIEVVYFYSDNRNSNYSRILYFVFERALSISFEVV